MNLFKTASLALVVAITPLCAQSPSLPELATQAKIYSVKLSPRYDQKWVDNCLNLSLDEKELGCKIVAYRVQYFSGSWSGWYQPGVNDLYIKAGEPLRRAWAMFNDHNFEFIYQTDLNPISFSGVIQ